jgi:hypothetical protein
MDKSQATGAGVETEPFRLVSGYLVVLENSLSGNVRGRADLESFYKSATSLKQRVYYILASVGVSTPFGYFVPEDRLKDMLPEIEEVRQQAKKINEIANGAFRLSLHVTFAALDPDDPVLCFRLREYVAETLLDARAKIIEGNPNALKYTQDPIHRLHIYCRGEYARRTLRAVGEAQEMIKQVKEGRKVKPEDFKILNETVAYLAADQA